MKTREKKRYSLNGFQTIYTGICVVSVDPFLVYNEYNIRTFFAAINVFSTHNEFHNIIIIIIFYIGL